MNKKYLFFRILVFVVLNDCFLNCTELSSQPAAQNNIHCYLSKVAANMTDQALSGIKTKGDWEKIRDQRYDGFLEMTGIKEYLYEERTPLNTKVVEVIQEKGFRIEKLIYESLPGLYVPANLYVPDHIEKPAAAILYAGGHSGVYTYRNQIFPRKFMEEGFVCLVIGTLQFGEVQGVHHGCYSKGWFHWYSRGYNPGGVELWNAIRGLDLLAARPDVDPEKLGVTGISGGGAQSWYIAAADPRVKATAPVTGASTLKAHIGQRTIDWHCDCMMPVNTYRIDFQDIGALIAPRPLLIGQPNRDHLITVESVRELYGDIKRIYELHGAPDHVSLVETPGPHAYHQIAWEKIHSFFLLHLKGKKVSDEEIGPMYKPEEAFPRSELAVYANGAPVGDRSATIQDSFVRLPEPPVISNEKELNIFRDSVKNQLKEKTFGAFPDKKISFTPRLEFQGILPSKSIRNVYSFNSEEGWRMKVDIKRDANPGKKPLMLALRSYDEKRNESENFVSGLDSIRNVAYLEVRGIGEMGWPPDQNWFVRRASAWTGRTVASMQVYDVLRCLEFCRTLDFVDPENIGLAARGGMAAIALYAALMDGHCKKLLLEDPPATQDAPSRPDGRGETIEMLNCLRITDVCQLPALLFPAEIAITGQIPVTYQWSQKTLEKLGRKELGKTGANKRTD